MRLLRAPEFCRRYFDEASRPSERTVRRWIQQGHVPGRQIGGSWYVDADQWEKSTGNQLADKVLNAKQ